MQSFLDRCRSAGIGAKLVALIVLFELIGFAALSWGLSHSSAKMLKQQAAVDIEAQEHSVIDMIQLFDKNLQQQTERFLSIFKTTLPGTFSLSEDEFVDISGRQVPMLSTGGEPLNLNFDIVDRFTAQAREPVTIFARSGEDFIRVTTSLKNDQGQRAVGTLLDRKSKSYDRLINGQVYSGLATLFGVPYITRYEPVKDNAGRIIGAVFIGVDITEEIAELKERIRALKVGERGYYMIVDAKPGDGYGKVLAGSPNEGSSILELTNDANEHVLKPMFDQPSGRVSYSLADVSDDAARTTYFEAYPDWEWIIAGTAMDDEINQKISNARNTFMLLALGLALLTAAILFFFVHKMVTKPLHKVVTYAQGLAKGDLANRITHTSQDEIGQLTNAMNGISDGLTEIVTQVRQSIDAVSHGSHEIAVGNADLSRRTESQAASLEQTAASIEQLSATVRQNNERTQESDNLVRAVSNDVGSAGQSVELTVEAMSGMKNTAKRISDIVGIIDSIAFQTNILALNASVEAARAGEHGSGFAVVASEVRMLAERSAKAAREIQALITHAVEEIGVGNSRADEAGQQMRDIVTRISSIVTVVAEISAASHEQLLGIEQINIAVSQLDETTQHNAALVEESAATTASLNEQAQTLRETVEVFRLSQGQAMT
ncbi:methyl-accepting chemotaxis protein [Phytohalomonas tamaricis]|uniref:methyl-accepting chemotaxis protein n=1 Tax=Phytohalomonas tamaricis TaxID=2081032 RepID=UPI000D0B712C|nr:methyl-accepting chemotaxis protein [Phytohalomonas tamaricis]